MGIFKKKVDEPKIEAKKESKALSQVDARLPDYAENISYYGLVDSYSADLSYSHSERKKQRERARFELDSSSYARGMVTTYAQDIVGLGPRLQVNAKDPFYAKKLEDDFSKWAEKVELASKLTTACIAEVIDGESFIEIVTNPALESDVKIDLKLLEADRIQETEYTHLDNPLNVDGVILDNFGNVKKYKVLNSHPGNGNYDYTYSSVDASFMCHMFKQIRPEQHRGMCEIAPVLPLFAQLKRYTLATLGAAEIAASLSTVIQSDFLPDDSEPLQAMDIVSLERNAATVMPAGWHIGQLKAEQPTTVYDAFKKAIVAEISRCLNMPYSVGACDSSGHNFSSAKLDTRTYRSQISIMQKALEKHLDKVFNQFFKAWISKQSIESEFKMSWYWSALDLSDPKDVSSTALKIEKGLMSYKEYYSKQGKDWETELEQISLEEKKLKELGLKKVDNNRGTDLKDGE